MTVPRGKASRLRRKSTKSFPASAKTTLLCFESIRSFKLILEVDIYTASYFNDHSQVGSVFADDLKAKRKVARIVGQKMKACLRESELQVQMTERSEHAPHYHVKIQKAKNIEPSQLEWKPTAWSKERKLPSWQPHVLPNSTVVER
uniref:Uncharacterized protein n=1 Tax=Salix viminalis TaxID=40686 RepID=A0A6N2MRW9_SALVM